MSTNSLPLFVYGTLLDRDILSCVLGRHFSEIDVETAYLAERETWTYPQESFPVLQRVSNGEVQGKLLYNMQPEDWRRIDFYEGDEYGFAEVEVERSDGQKVIALLNSACDEALATKVPWTLEMWQRAHKRVFLPKCQRYMALYGTMSIEEADVYWQAWQRE